MSRTIAWIEDDIDYIKAIVEPLREMGFVFDESRNYTEAIEKLEKLRSVDLILLDLILPPGNSNEAPQSEYLGIDLLLSLRRRNVSAPVVVFSVVSDLPEIRAYSLEKLNATLVQKPIRPSKLKAHVLERLGISQDTQSV